MTTTNIIPPSLREQFEQQILASGQFDGVPHVLLFSTYENGAYKNQVIHGMWMGYQLPRADMPLYLMFDKAIASLIVISEEDLEAQLAPFNDHENFEDIQWRIDMMRKYR